jgi:hypothetical protein
VGEVIGFALGWDGQEQGVLWISGAPEGVCRSFRWLPIGVGVEVSDQAR